VSDKDNGGPAFPWGEHGTVLGGITLRDYFAAHAPSAPEWWLKDYIKGRQLDEDASVHAQWAWSYADAMLKTREQ
jgi:hypothetical protein